MMVLLVMVMVMMEMMEMMVAWSASLIASEQVAVAVGNPVGVYQYLQASSKWWWYSWCWRGLKSRCSGVFLLVLFYWCYLPAILVSRKPCIRSGNQIDQIEKLLQYGGVHDDIDDNDDNDNDNDEDQTCLVSLPGVGRTPKPWLTRVVHKVVWLN